jgi:redox-sensitive bicupin YhaK (pirin superfamily)
MRKALHAIHRTTDSHWVGDGFPVRTLFSYQGFGAQLSPFLLLDYAGPAEFAPTTHSRGVGAHPHRGFETVTIVYRGEVEHRDSGGNHGRIGPGDVQWMTAASGILHEEMHAKSFSERGGAFEVVQLWVNLPQRFKMSPPRYQTLIDAEIPVVELPDGAGSARLIAGSFGGKQGPAQTFTPINLWDLRLRAGKHTTLKLTEG